MGASARTLKRVAGWGAVAVAALLPAAASSAFLFGFSRIQVFSLNKQVFEVVGDVGAGPSDYWCGAGYYAISYLRVPQAQRIYIWKAIGPSVALKGHKAVQFAFSPPPGKENYQPGYSLSVKAEGDNISAAMAYRYCINDEIFF